MVPLPLSIPSPPDEWRIFELGTWLRSFLPFWPEALSVPIHAYAICILLGIVAAILISNRRLTRRGGEPWVTVDIAIWAVLLGIVGSRFFHVITHPGDYFGPGRNTWNVFETGSVWAVWEGGVAIYGALIGGAIGVYIACRIAGLRFTSALDAIAPGMLIAQAFGRLGNWFNHELFGLPTDAPWGLEIEKSNSAWPAGLPEGTLFQPTFLYEIVWLVAGFAVISFITRKDTFQWGKVLAMYLIWQGAGRSFFESIRVDPSEYYFGIRANVWAALGAVLIGVIIFIVQSRRHTGHEPSVYRHGREWTPDSGVDSPDTYSDSDDPDDAADDESGTEKPATSGATVSS